MRALAPWQRIGIGCGAAMFVCMALGRFSYATMIPALVEHGKMSAVAAGYIGGANLFGHLLGAVASVSAARAVDVRTLMTGAVACAVAALIASAIDVGVLWLGFWRFLIGVMTGFVMVQSLALTTLYAPADRRPQAASYVFVGVGCGILFTGSAVPVLLTNGLAAAWWGIAAVGAAAGATAIWALAIVHPQPTSHAADSLTKPPNTLAWYALVAASFLFSLGLVPHTIYWFDFLARDLGHGYAFAGGHWLVVGLFGILGPILIATAARRLGTALATALIFILLGVGLALPASSTGPVALALTSVIFGMQPGVSTMIAARARDLGRADQTPHMMRTTIVANGIGAALGGALVPALLDATASYIVLFLAGAAAFLVGGLICLPFLAAKAVAE